MIILVLSPFVTPPNVGDTIFNQNSTASDIVTGVSGNEITIDDISTLFTIGDEVYDSTQSNILLGTINNIYGTQNSTLSAESFNQFPLATIVPSYAYFQYADDVSIQAFISSFNSITQSYLNWFVNTPLAVYVLSTINGELLDWIGQSLYGYSRPLIVFKSIYGNVTGYYGSGAYGKTAYGKIRQKVTPGTAVSVNDDVYKRALTWHLYLGDGKQMTIQWVKRRIARFLYGVDGTDIPFDDLQNVSVAFSTYQGHMGYYGSGAYGAVAFGKIKKTNYTHKTMTITLPNIPISSTLQALLLNGFLAFPFQVNLLVNIA